MSYICKLTLKKDGETVIQEHYTSREAGYVEFTELLKYYKIPYETATHRVPYPFRELWEAVCTDRQLVIKLKVNNEKI